MERKVKKELDVLVIGGGPAGLMAGVYAARSGQNTAIIEKETCGGQITQTGEIENMPGFVMTTGPELAMAMTEQAMNSGVEIEFDMVEEIKFGKKAGELHTVITSEAEFETKTVIITTGAGPRKLSATGAAQFDGRGIHYCALCDGAFYREKNVLVVGGGNTAIEDALYLAGIAKSVTVVDFADEFIAHKVMVDKLMERENVKTFHGYAVQEIIGDKKIESIRIKKNSDNTEETLAIDGVFVAIGRIPNTTLFKDLIEMTKYGYVVVDEKMQTSVPGVFSAGDLNDKQVRQIVTAVSDGCIAAVNADQYIKEHF